METYDAVVVGAGAAGGWAAKELCERGLTVCLLDAGPVVGPAAAGGPRMLAKAAALAGGQHVQARSGAFGPQTRRFFVDDRECPYTTAPGTPFNWFRGRQVGGRLHLWMRVAPRMTDRELGGWPLDAAELAPYYDRVERFLAVARARLTPDEDRLKAAIEARWPERVVRGAPTAAAERGPVPRTVEAALATGRLTLRPDAVVRRVEVDRNGLATGVSLVDRVSRVGESLGAGAVVLAASTIETIRLLLNSTSAAHPNGLGNSSGLLGRGLMDHVLSAVGGPHPGRTPADASPVGFQIAPLGRVFGIQGAVGRGDWWNATAIGEMLPRPENRVTLSPSVRDAWGVPAAHIRCTFSPAEQALVREQTAVLHELAGAAGLPIASGRSILQSLVLRLWQRRLGAPGSAAHETGGAALGSDPASSVLDPFSRCWDAPNVLVVDGAAFPTCGWQNVTLTIAALAARASERLAGELGAHRP